MGGKSEEIYFINRESSFQGDKTRIKNLRSFEDILEDKTRMKNFEWIRRIFRMEGNEEGNYLRSPVEGNITGLPNSGLDANLAKEVKND